MQAAKLGCDTTNPSVQLIYPRSKALHIYAKETRNIPIQDLVSFLRIQLIDPRIPSIITRSITATNLIPVTFHIYPRVPKIPKF